MKRGWYQEKQEKLKKYSIMARKESRAISLIDEGHAGRLSDSVKSTIDSARAQARKHQEELIAELKGLLGKTDEESVHRMSKLIVAIGGTL